MSPNVGKYTIHGWYGLSYSYSVTPMKFIYSHRVFQKIDQRLRHNLFASPSPRLRHQSLQSPLLGSTLDFVGWNSSSFFNDHPGGLCFLSKLRSKRKGNKLVWNCWVLPVAFNEFNFNPSNFTNHLNRLMQARNDSCTKGRKTLPSQEQIGKVFTSQIKPATILHVILACFGTSLP